MYYKNQPCEVLSEFGDKAVISLVVQNYQHYYGNNSFEPEDFPIEIIVEKKYLSGKFLDFEGMFDQQRTEVEKEMNKLRAEKKKDLDALKKEADDLKDEMKLLKLKASKYDGMNTMMNFLNGEYKYVLFHDSYNNTVGHVKELSEVKCDEELVAVIFRTNRSNHKKGEVVPYLSEYGDGSGKGTRISKFLKTDEEAKETIKKLYDSGNLKQTTKDDILFAKLGLNYILDKRNEELHKKQEESILKNVEAEVKKILLYKQKLKNMGIDITDKLLDKPS